MAKVKIIENPVNTDLALINLCNYIVRESKTRYGSDVFGRGLDPDNAYNDICEAQSLTIKKYERKAYHIVVSFEKKRMLNSRDIMEIMYPFTDLFAPEYQVLCGVHSDTNCPHAHLAVSTVSLMGGHNLSIDEKKLWLLRNEADRLEYEFIHGE